MKKYTWHNNLFWKIFYIFLYFVLTMSWFYTYSKLPPRGQPVMKNVSIIEAISIVYNVHEIFRGSRIVRTIGIFFQYQDLKSRFVSWIFFQYQDLKSWYPGYFTVWLTPFWKRSQKSKPVSFGGGSLLCPTYIPPP